MSQPIQPTVHPREILTALKRHYRLWIIPAVATTLATAVYALLRPATWEASQAMVVRDEAVGNLNRVGRFDNVDAMKTAQETVLEVARNRQVVRAALAEIGPPAECRSPDTWPSAGDVLVAQRAITVTAPKGAEFGQTEVIYLKVKRPSSERAIALARAACRALEARLQELRDSKARSMIAELTKTLSLAQAELDAATGKLEEMEKETGSD
ncbi:unnamed protein product, partial [marine sediment metagenome]